jgi:PAP2 superfamily
MKMDTNTNTKLPASAESTAASAPTVNPDTGEGEFADGDWDAAYVGQLAPIPRWFLDPKRLALNPPAGKAVDECAALNLLKPLRTREQLERVRRQAQSEKHAIQPVLDVLGINYDRPPTTEGSKLRHQIQSNIWHITFTFKVQYKRARPSKKCGSIPLAPLFDRPDRCHPGHPAYPSGHATMAYAWAYFLAYFVPQRKDLLLSAATEVALNREIAGVHYASDSEAGRLLGAQIADGIFNGGELNASERKVLLQGWL